MTTAFPSDSPPTERGNYMVAHAPYGAEYQAGYAYRWREAIWSGIEWRTLRGDVAKISFWRHATEGELPTDPLKRSIGRTPKAIAVDRSRDGDSLRIDFDDGSALSLHHDQDCCESVSIEDVAGDFEDLIGHPLLYADEVSTDEKRDYSDDEQWTFYTFRSHGGTVVVRWYGTSNGYYSISVSSTFRDPP